jgi:hypothetical protein
MSDIVFSGPTCMSGILRRMSANPIQYSIFMTMGRGRPGLIRGCLSHTRLGSGDCAVRMSHTSRRYPDLLSGCRVVCRGDKHEKCAWLQQTGDDGCRRAVRPIGARAGPCTGPEAITGCVALHKATIGLFVAEIKSGARTMAPRRRR